MRKLDIINLHYYDEWRKRDPQKSKFIGSFDPFSFQSIPIVPFDENILFEYFDFSICTFCRFIYIYMPYNQYKKTAKYFPFPLTFKNPF